MQIISSIRNIISRYLMPRILLKWSDQDIVLRKREEKEEIRKKEGRPHEVFYFHELLDPYSHITAQLINKFTSEYSVEIVPMIVNEPPSKTVHEPSLYRKYSYRSQLSQISTIIFIIYSISYVDNLKY